MTTTTPPPERPGAVFNTGPATLLPAERVLRHGMLYSVGIHPWNASCATATDFREVMAMAASPRVVAIGETGLDTVHQGYEWIDLPGGGKEIVQCIPSLERQMEVLDFHIRLSERLRKPLLLHIVKRYPEIIRLRNKLKPSQPWIIHGFRGKPGLAQDLLKFGFMLSYGERFNPLSVAVTPPGRICGDRRVTYARPRHSTRHRCRGHRHPPGPLPHRASGHYAATRQAWRV